MEIRELKLSKRRDDREEAHLAPLLLLLHVSVSSSLLYIHAHTVIDLKAFCIKEKKKGSV